MNKQGFSISTVLIFALALSRPSIGVAKDVASPCAEKLTHSSKKWLAKKYSFLPLRGLTVFSGHLVVREGLRSEKNFETGHFINSLGKVIKASYLVKNEGLNGKKKEKALIHFKKKYLKDRTDLDIEEIASAFVKADESNLFCTQDDSGKLVLNYRHFFSFVSERKGRLMMQKLAWLFFPQDGGNDVELVIDTVKKAQSNLN